jgi:hypothetical protein
MEALRWVGDARVTRILRGRHGSAIIISGVFIGMEWRSVRDLARHCATRHDCWVVALFWDMTAQDGCEFNAQTFLPKGFS